MAEQVIASVRRPFTRLEGPGGKIATFMVYMVDETDLAGSSIMYTYHIQHCVISVKLTY